MKTTILFIVIMTLCGCAFLRSALTPERIAEGIRMEIRDEVRDRLAANPSIKPYVERARDVVCSSVDLTDPPEPLILKQTLMTAARERGLRLPEGEEWLDWIMSRYEYWLADSVSGQVGQSKWAHAVLGAICNGLKDALAAP